MRQTLIPSLLGLGSLALAAPAPSSLVTISTAVDASSAAAWWDPLDEFGGYDYLAYLRNPPGGSGGSLAQNNVMVARRDVSTGAIVRDCVKTGAGECAVEADDAGHSVPSVAVDGAGYVHVFTSMHNEHWKYFRSSSPQDPTSLADRSGEMPDQTVNVTYPVVKRDAAGDLWLMVRGWAAGDTSAKGGYLYRYTTASGTWARVSLFAYSRGYSVYPDDIQFSSDGDVHLQWEWSKYPASGVRHEGSYARYSPSTGKFRAASGQEVPSLPMTQATPDLVFQPLTGGESYAHDIGASPAPALQSAKMALYERPAGSVHVQVAYRFQAATGGPWQVRRARADFGSGAGPWTREVVYAGGDTSAGLGITHDGATVRIYYCRVGGSAQVLERTGSSGWTDTALGPVAGKQVQRLQAIMRADGTDVLYLGAPKNVDASTGSLYYLTVGGR
ncbi:uncharacterized protein E0L32_004581 [Thyridium curvatum]|uniref:Uncharacterized protein n=1 Tax=Thyridium curvatum TaxID=1093900 RepID=A0A507B9L2_9PEZI|nr:uncharacterized protein E0L32_004581 [Thyridium curvatum]TPX15304.1 hypothetical protein E0L32_004581 [Thyridium curvatum]